MQFNSPSYFFYHSVILNKEVSAFLKSREQGTIVIGHLLISWTHTSKGACYFGDNIRFRCVRSAVGNIANYNRPLPMNFQLFNIWYLRAESLKRVCMKLVNFMKDCNLPKQNLHSESEMYQNVFGDFSPLSFCHLSNLTESIYGIVREGEKY